MQQRPSKTDCNLSGWAVASRRFSSPASAVAGGSCTVSAGASLLAFRRATHTRAFDACQCRLFATVIPMRRADN